MAAEKNFENQVKRWLKDHGIYPLGTPKDKIRLPPVGYYEKRWGGGYSKAGLPDMHIVANGISLDVELKASNGIPSELQKHNIAQINACGSIGLILYPEGFDAFKNIMEGVISCNTHIPELTALASANSSTKCAMWTG